MLFLANHGTFTIIMRRIWFYCDSICCRLDFAVIAHTVDAYVITGFMIWSYSRSLFLMFRLLFLWKRGS